MLLKPRIYLFNIFLGLFCMDLLPTSYCKKLSSYNNCKKKPVRMAVYCPRTCGYCNGSKPSCADIKCPPAKICVLNAAGQPTCKCLVECTRKLETGPVCGMNGKEYPDLCDLKNDECVKGDYILVRKYGGCGPTITCADKEREAKAGLCKAWQKNNACFDHPVLMRTFCPKTCGFCRQATEPKCTRSKYGCCWNAKGNVPAKGPYGQGCGACQDKPFCKYFKNCCGGLRSVNVEIMKKFCPFTCHYCQPGSFIGG